MFSFQSSKQGILPFSVGLSSPTIGLLVIILLPGLLLSGCGVFGGNDNSVDDFKGVSVAGTIDRGGSSSGTLDESDDQLNEIEEEVGNGSAYMDLYEFEGDPDNDRPVRITLRSSDFNAFLIVYDRDGERVRFNDDLGFDTTNARIVESFSGKHIITVTSVNQNTGDYEVSVERAGQSF